MSKALHGRLRRLEDHYRPAIEALRKPAKPPGPSAIELIMQGIDEAGFVRDPKESKVEWISRALGWTPREFRNFLERRAVGLE